MSIKESLTHNLDFCPSFSDLTIIPRIPRIAEQDVRIRSRVLKNLSINIPFIASPMDTVTDSSVAIKLAELGLLAVLHYNYPDLSTQLDELRKVKSHPVEDSPEGSTMRNGKLAAGVLVKTDFDLLPHIEKLVEADVDFVAIDSLHSAPELHLPFIGKLKESFPELAIMSGNVVHPDDCLALIEQGVDGVRVGFSAASINVGRVLFGTGRSQVKAIYECARVCKAHDVPLIADGGLNSTGDLAIAFALGADCLMMGRMFAACTDTPGEFIEDKDGRKMKLYKGMSRKDLLSGGMIAEGVELLLPCTEDLKQFTARIASHLQVSVARAGATSLADLYKEGILEIAPQQK
ncbi:MAG TPA: guanosine monophosphate reductase [Pyrinomonadaceae bacterium]|nr:guanosine monophosphate reductase [Pyrinomonadaceae bacterium]